MACDPADGAQERDGAKTDADVAVRHPPEFGVRPARGEVVERFGRDKKIAYAFEDEGVFEIGFVIVKIEHVQIYRRNGHALARDFGERKRGHGDVHARDGVLEDGKFERLRMRAQQTGEPAAQ